MAYQNRVLVTGADGFIGSHLVEQLIKKRLNVSALYLYNAHNNIGSLKYLEKKNLSRVKLIPGDVRDKSLMEEITKNVDVVYHLAALISVPYSYKAPESFFSTNVNGTLNVLQSCMRNSVKKIICTSTSEIYGTALYTPIDEEHKIQTQSPYAASKISADHLIESFAKTYNLPALIARPFNTYGPRQSEKAVIPNIIRQILDENCKEIKLGDISTRRDFNYIKDTVEAFISFSNIKSNKVKFGEAYNFASEKSYSIEDVINLLFNISGIKKPIKCDKQRIRPKNSEVKLLEGCAKKFKSITKWKSKVDLKQGLKETFMWMEKNKSDILENKKFSYFY